MIKISCEEIDCFTAGFSGHRTESKGGWVIYNDVVRATTEMAKLTQSLKVLNILIHNFPEELVVKDWIAGSKMPVSDERDWDWPDKGWKCPDNEVLARDLTGSGVEACYLIFEPPRNIYEDCNRCLGSKHVPARYSGQGSRGKGQGPS